MNNDIDLPYLREWIGREDVSTEVLTPTLVDRYRQTLDLSATRSAVGDSAEGLVHFCLCQPTVPTAQLGADGHPVKGGFLPPIPLPRRMWAESDIHFHSPVQVGEHVKRTSRISDVALKNGRSGSLCFVSVSHDLTSGSRVLITERQTLVYRAFERSPATSEPPPPPAPAPRGDVVQERHLSAALLFRYSALTFNAHRIHYDLPYATLEEGYRGLVVHGPLQATLLFHLATEQQNGRAPSHFRFRGLSPAVAETPLILHAQKSGLDHMTIWTAHPGGPIAMTAEAHWS